MRHLLDDGCLRIAVIANRPGEGFHGRGTGRWIIFPYLSQIRISDYVVFLRPLPTYVRKSLGGTTRP